VKKGIAGVLAGVVVLGMAACASARLQLDPGSRNFYETAQLVMTGEEEEIFRRLPDAESRREFIADFWKKRDPDPDTDINEFKQEFEQRIAYANKHFVEGRRGMNTDRGRIYVYLGPPDKTDYFHMVRSEEGAGQVIQWSYYFYDLGIQFSDVRGSGSYVMAEVVGNLMQAIAEAKLGAVMQGAGETGRLLQFDLSYDKAGRELVLKFPVKKLNFKEESGILQAHFEIEFYIYKSGGAGKENFTADKTFAGKAGDIERMKDIVFTFPYDLPPGKTYVDVIVADKNGRAKSRRIFSVKN
jgi:GWxTD domain-containing protein